MKKWKVSLFLAPNTKNRFQTRVNSLQGMHVCADRSEGRAGTVVLRRRPGAAPIVNCKLFAFVSLQGLLMTVFDAIQRRRELVRLLTMHCVWFSSAFYGESQGVVVSALSP